MPNYDWRTEDRERERWEREGTPPRHHDWRRDDPAAIYQERSFQPPPHQEARHREEPRYRYGEQPRVFGERETGVDYRGGPRLTQGGYSQEGYSPAGVGGGPDYGRQGFGDGERAPQGGDDQPAVGNAGYGQGGFGPSNFRQGERDPGGYGGYGIGASETYAGGESPQRHESGSHWWDRAAQRVERWMGNVDRERSWEANHRGKGPKGYTRSDERIRDDVHDRLTEDPYIDASEVEVRVEGGEITLNGVVDSRRAKHHAEHCIEDISGVRHVQNNLRVQDHGGRDRGTDYSASADQNTVLTAQAKSEDSEPRN
jgi:osmotically-inducible protein OsmY